VLSACIGGISNRLQTGSVVSVKVRAYGGWFNGHAVSNSRYKAAQFYQALLPAAFSTSGYLCRSTFEFADFLAPDLNANNRVPISHTVVRRERPFSVSPRIPRLACDDPECALNQVFKWLRKAKACFKPSCQHNFSEAFDRLEQKQVDVHMALDLVFLAERITGLDHIILFSDDLDLIPAIVSAKRRMGERAGTISLLRCIPPSPYIIDTLANQGIPIILMNGASGGGSHAGMGQNLTAVC
jgi:hypothetical protein